MPAYANMIGSRNLLPTTRKNKALVIVLLSFLHIKFSQTDIIVWNINNEMNRDGLEHQFSVYWPESHIPWTLSEYTV